MRKVAAQQEQSDRGEWQRNARKLLNEKPVQFHSLLARLEAEQRSQSKKAAAEEKEKPQEEGAQTAGPDEGEKRVEELIEETLAEWEWEWEQEQR